jgi:hypothetical protein
LSADYTLIYISNIILRLMLLGFAVLLFPLDGLVVRGEVQADAVDAVALISRSGVSFALENMT